MKTKNISGWQWMFSTLKFSNHWILRIVWQRVLGFCLVWGRRDGCLEEDGYRKNSSIHIYLELDPFWYWPQNFNYAMLLSRRDSSGDCLYPLWLFLWFLRWTGEGLFRCKIILVLTCICQGHGLWGQKATEVTWQEGSLQLDSLLVIRVMVLVGYPEQPFQWFSRIIFGQESFQAFDPIVQEKK